MGLSSKYLDKIDDDVDLESKIEEKENQNPLQTLRNQ